MEVIYVDAANPKGKPIILNELLTSRVVVYSTKFDISVPKQQKFISWLLSFFAYSLKYL